MKRILAVVFLLVSFASVAMADGSGQTPPPSAELAHPFLAA